MKIAFIHPSPRSYTPLSPHQRPMGGSLSALAYLAVALAARGHQLALVNHIDHHSGIYAGIEYPGKAGFTADFLNRFDAVIVLNHAIGQRMRDAGVTRRLVLWTQHTADIGAIAALKSFEERAAWESFFMVSDWQAKGYSAAFGIPPERMVVLRNAVAPAFLTLERRTKPFFLTGKPPVLFYTSTPHRGLWLLLTAFPMIRAAIPNCELKVFSSFAVYNNSEADDQFRMLYELTRALPGAEYVGSLPQPELAQSLAAADILAYPNTYAETSCIAVMEAMAAGCLTSRLGALPETTANFGFLMTPPTPELKSVKDFAEFTIDVVNRARADPASFEDRLVRQRALVRDAYSWEVRARQWELALSHVLSNQG